MLRWEQWKEQISVFVVVSVGPMGKVKKFVGGGGGGECWVSKMTK